MKLSLLVALAACGGTASPPPPASPVPTGVLDATRASPSDEIVATVDGHPVWASCVEEQAARDHVGAKRALDECVGFELMAQAAVARGLAADPELDLAGVRAQAMVNAAVEKEFEDVYTTPAALGAPWKNVADKLMYRVKHDEARGSTYARVPVAPDASEAQVAKAKGTADAIAAKLVGRHGLFAVDLMAAADEVGAVSGQKIERLAVPTTLKVGFDPSYADPLWSIPEVGDAIGPVRTKWGWDVIVLTDVLPAENGGEAELAAIYFDETRMGYFSVWVDALARDLGLPTVAEARISPNLRYLEDEH